MSNALAVATVTAVLQSFLNNIFNNLSSVLGSVQVSAVAPDLVPTASGNNTKPQVNLFLHQVTPNAAWRNMGYPSLAPDGITPLKNPPLALDLHYLLTAYGWEDNQAEALLSYAVAFLHDNPVLTRAQIATGLSGLPVNSFNDGLRSSGLADQVEMIKITPATLGREEMAWLWTALKSDYRPTFPFQVSVVLIQPQQAVISALPVLQRMISAQAGMLSPFPTITAVNPPNGQPAACVKDIVTVEGTNLAGASGVTGVLLVNSKLGVQQSIPLLGAGSTSFQFKVPDSQPPPNDLPAGVYLLSGQLPSGPGTNGLPLALAPQIDPAWAPGTLPSGTVTVTVPCAPYLRPGQQASLLIGGQETPADPFTAATNSPSFTYPALQPTPAVPVRLRVDGVDSPIIDMTQSPPQFTGPTVTVS